MTTKKRAKAAPATRPAPSASEPWTRSCPDCVPELWIQGGDWGWRAHRWALHGEGEHPGPMPGAVGKGPPPDRKPWTEEQRAEFHRRRAAAGRRARYAPPPRTPRPPGAHG